MAEFTNALGQPIGAPVPGWEKRLLPPRTPMEGRTCRVVPLDPARHAEDLFEAMGRDQDGRNWTYLAIGPFAEFDSFRAWLGKMAAGSDPLFHAVIDRAAGRAVGVAAYLRIDPANGAIEVGHIHFSPLLQRTPMATEAMVLMMRRVFDELGYRRYEWKCDSLNAPSRAAAARLGFQYEGLFRQAVVYKGRNRDTAWFSIIDGEWPRLRAAFERWLDPANFDAEGRQRESLSTLTRPDRP
jgi:RimJ/RimL family protein N-acetyltransferase